MTTLYLDMDGVVADFDAYAVRVLHHDRVTHNWSAEDWAKISQFTRIYRDLNKMKEADQLVSFCRWYAQLNHIDLMFLTAVPKGNDMKWAFMDKVNWAQRYYPDIPVMFGPYSKDKASHCFLSDILVDDRESNVDEWRAAGGRAVLHRRNKLEDTITALAKI